MFSIDVLGASPGELERVVPFPRSCPAGVATLSRLTSPPCGVSSLFCARKATSDLRLIDSSCSAGSIGRGEEPQILLARSSVRAAVEKLGAHRRIRRKSRSEHCVSVSYIAVLRRRMPPKAETVRFAPVAIG